MGDQPTDYSSIDSFHVGRRRKPNFTDHEVLNIVDQYDTYKELLHSREASKTVIAQKQAIWKHITDNLNATYPQVERTVEDVRRKWKKLQSEAKREATAYRAALQAGTTTSISSKQINLYNRILNICRPSTVSTGNSSGTPFNHSATFAAAAALHHQQQQQQQQHQISHSSVNDIDQTSEKADSPSSDLAIGGGSNPLDSPADESPSLLCQDENSNSPKATTMPSTSVSLSGQMGQTSSMNNGQISRRTLDKRRKASKSNTYSTSTTYNPRNYVQQQNSLRYESLLKRKRSLELTSQRLKYEKERLLIERKNLDLKLATNECEHERCSIDRRRIDLALQKLQSEQSSTNHNDVQQQQQQQQAQPLSDQEDVLEEHPSYDDEMSDINE